MFCFVFFNLHFTDEKTVHKEGNMSTAFRGFLGKGCSDGVLEVRPVLEKGLKMASRLFSSC